MDNLYYEFYQANQIATATAAAANAQDRIGRLQDDLSYLTARLEKLTLINAGMWELLKERCGISEFELKAKMLELDAADGAIDGKMKSARRMCADCGKALHPRHSKCLYCGKDNIPVDVHTSI